MDIMDMDMDQFLHYNDLLGDMMDCEEEECGPPLFSVPPPPPPPWLEMPPLCDTCGSVPAVATVTHTWAGEVFRSAVVVTVLAACLTIAAITLAVTLRRRLASRAKNTSAENLTADSAALATAAEKQLPAVRPPPQNYYSRGSHRVLVDQLGRATLLAPDQPIYETIDGEEVYSEQYSQQYREQFSEQYSHQYSLPNPALFYKSPHMGVVSLYENPDGVSLYQPATANTLYQPSTANTLYRDQGSLNTSSQYQEVAPCPAPGPAPAPGLLVNTEVRLLSHHPYHISPL